MDMVKVKTADLAGPALDWAVAQVAGVKVITDPNSPRQRQMVEDPNAVNGWFCYSPSTDWSQGGPLLETHSVSCYQSADPATGKIYHWVGVYELVAPGKRRGLIASKPLIAICRAIVAAKLGDDVEVPQELISSQG